MPCPGRAERGTPPPTEFAPGGRRMRRGAESGATPGAEMAAARAVEGAAEGLVDPAAFPAFYERTLPHIYGYFLRRCGGVAAVAEDLTQETYPAPLPELKRRRAGGHPHPPVP